MNDNLQSNRQDDKESIYPSIKASLYPSTPLR